MFYYYNALQTKSGDILPDYLVRLLDADGNEVDIYADDSSTPIISVSGVANAAKADDLGMVRFWVPNGTYDIAIYDTTDTFKGREEGVPMFDAGTLTTDLSGTDGATLVGTPTGTVQDDIDAANAAIDARPTTAALASSTGGAMVGFIQTGTGAEARTIEAKARDIVSALDFGAVGDGVTDDSAALQAAADALTDGGSLLLPRGNYFLDSGITVSNSNVILAFEDGAVITYTDATMTPITLASDNSGIKGGRIDAPAVFDGTNGAITYAVVRAQGEYNVISGLTISNVPRVGIWFDDCTNGIVANCVIDGGTSEGFFTGANTVHFGIAIDVAGTGSQGNFVISGNIIRRCVQGAGSGSVGAATYEQSMTVSGNVFELCWNHGWYTSGLAHGISVTGNAFNACQIPIALTGWDHAVVGNTLTVQTSGTGVAADNEITGISLRDPVRCVVSSNVIKGEGVAGGVVIGLDDNSGVPGADAVTDNIVSNNTITITNSTVAGVVAIRLLSSAGAVSNNIVEGNTVNAPLRSGDGLVIVQGAASLSFNNAVRGNVLNLTGIRGSGYAILAVNLDTTDISNNVISIQCDASSAMVLTLVALVSCSYAAARNNLMSCTAAWGDDISVRCFQEITSSEGNVATSNLVRMDLTKLTAFDVFLSPMIVDHTAAGDPEGAIIARVGSIWRRTDGGASTTLYIKESGTGNTGWIAK